MCDRFWSVPCRARFDLTIFAETDYECMLVGFKKLKRLAVASLYVSNGAGLVIEIDKRHSTGATLIHLSDINVEAQTAAHQVVFVGIVHTRVIWELPDEGTVVFTHDDLSSLCVQISGVPTLDPVVERGTRSRAMHHWDGLKCGFSSRRVNVASAGQERDIGEDDTIV